MPENKKANSNEPLKPSDDKSIFLRYSDSSKDSVDEIIETFEKMSVTPGKNFYCITFAETEQRDAEKNLIEEKLKELDASVSNYKMPFHVKRAEEAKRKVYVGNFPEAEEVTEEILQKIFKTHGEIEEIILGEKFAFVKYIECSSAENAAKTGAKLNGKEFLVEMSRKPRSFNRGNPQRRTVMITNFNRSVNKKPLLDLASKEGEIQSFQMFSDNAIVTYRSPESAESAIKNIMGKNVDGNELVAIYAPRIASSAPRRGRRGKRRGRGRKRVSSKGSSKKMSVEDVAPAEARDEQGEE